MRGPAVDGKDLTLIFIEYEKPTLKPYAVTGYPVSDWCREWEFRTKACNDYWNDRVSSKESAIKAVLDKYFKDVYSSDHEQFNGSKGKGDGGYESNIYVSPRRRGIEYETHINFKDRTALAEIAQLIGEVESVFHELESDGCKLDGNVYIEFNQPHSSKQSGAKFGAFGTILEQIGYTAYGLEVLVRGKKDPDRLRTMAEFRRYNTAIGDSIFERDILGTPHDGLRINFSKAN